jgi:hypothetical protein
VLFAHGIKPVMERVRARMDVLDYGFEQSSVQAAPELRNSSDVVGRPTGLTAEMLEFRDKFLQGVPLHFDLQELLVSSQLLLAVGERVSEIPFE